MSWRQLGIAAAFAAAIVACGGCGGKDAPSGSSGLGPTLLDAMRLHAEGRYGEAAAAYLTVQASLEKADDVARAAWLRALALDQSGLDATEALLAARHKAPGLAAVWRQSAERALDAGQLGDAASFAAKAISLDPKDPMAHVMLARVQRAKGEPEKAEATVQAALGLDAEYPAARHLFGVLLLERGDPSAKVWLTTSAGRRSDVLRDPTFREVLWQVQDARGVVARAESLRAASDPGAALALLEAKGGQGTEALALKADLLFQTGKAADALRLWALLSAREDAPARAFERLATSAMDQGQFVEAQRLAEETLRRDPGAPGAMLVRGAVCLKRGAPAEALSDLRRVVVLRPEWALARKLLIEALEAVAPTAGAASQAIEAEIRRLKSAGGPKRS